MTKKWSEFNWAGDTTLEGHDWGFLILRCNHRRVLFTQVTLLTLMTRDGDFKRSVTRPFPEGTFVGKLCVCDRGAIARVQKRKRS